MKYGLIEDGKCICYGNDDLGKWQGRIEYNENHERLTATEMIAKYALKPIVFNNSTFNNNYQDYNFVEEADRIVIADMIAEIKEEQEKAVLKAEISRLKALTAATDYKVIKYAEAVSLGLDKPYTAEEMTALAIERQGYRTQINELELKL